MKDDIHTQDARAILATLATCPPGRLAAMAQTLRLTAQRERERCAVECNAVGRNCVSLEGKFWAQQCADRVRAMGEVK